MFAAAGRGGQVERDQGDDDLVKVVVEGAEKLGPKEAEKPPLLQNVGVTSRRHRGYFETSTLSSGEKTVQCKSFDDFLGSGSDKIMLMGEISFAHVGIPCHFECFRPPDYFQLADISRFADGVAFGTRVEYQVRLVFIILCNPIRGRQ